MTGKVWLKSTQMNEFEKELSQKRKIRCAATLNSIALNRIQIIKGLR